MAGYSLLDRPVLGPMSLRQVGQGLKDALVAPIAADEQALYDQRHAHPVADLAASQFPAYGIPAAVQDAAHNPENAVLELAGAVPVVKGLRGAAGIAKEFAQMGRKGTHAGGAVVAGALGVTGANAYARGQEIMNSEGK